ncbi:MAG: type III-A CRISPR-associated RAMP protein Csm3 [Phycisphaerae bacterium]
MKLINTKRITGKIVVETGLHIGGSVESMEIGGVDNPIIKNKSNGEPYIPGSSLKGKMRSLTDWQEGTMQANGETCNCGKADCPVCSVFGVSANKNNTLMGPTRLIVRDCFISKETKDKFKAGWDITEIKHENSINRITAAANPRPLERVVPGVSFDIDICFRVFDMEDGGKRDEDNFDNVVLRALAMVQQDCLGGAGSRGCGKVRFEGLKNESGESITLPTI